MGGGSEGDVDEEEGTRGERRDESSGATGESPSKGVKSIPEGELVILLSVVVLGEEKTMRSSKSGFVLSALVHLVYTR